TTYTVTATNGFGCTAEDSVAVTVTSAPPLTVSNDTAMCAGGAATLSASGSVNYTWQPGNLTGSTINVSPATTTTYVVTGNNNNCMSTDTIVVTISPPPSIFAGPDFSICSGNQATLTTVSNATAYSWQPSSGIVGSNTTQNVVVQPTTNTSYTVTVTGPGGCISSDTLNITVNPTPTVTATASPSAICIGQATTLTGSGASTYSWIPAVGVQNPASGNTSANPTNTTTYQLVGTNAFGCMDTTSVTVTINPLPEVVVTPNATNCGDSTGSVTMNGVVAGTGPFTYQIGSQTYNNLPITNLPAGTYTMITTDANGCVSSQTFGIPYVINSTVSASASPDFGVYPLNVNFAASGTNGINNYVWSLGDSTQFANYTYGAPGTYTVIVAAWNDDVACTVYDTVVVTVIEQALIKMPNVFTPNNDGTNDWFAADVSGVSDITVEIFDRWGAQIYDGSVNGISGSQQTVPLWDGKSKGGATAHDGVYYYVVTATGYDTKQYPMTGFVHLITTK
ncbi:MAG TPA: gliding motility-associated C-terminal domain-containing protein, partial [Bacteroidia bacterium]|nr:gliding motility-associated C-terminal domain-containing protein [Bacteroidia bacterium]